MTEKVKCKCQCHTNPEIKHVAPCCVNGYIEVTSIDSVTSLLLEQRNEQITLLEAYSKFLEDRGYLDTDWRAEAPYAIDEFLKTQKP